MRFLTLVAVCCLTLPLSGQTVTKNIHYTDGESADLYEPIAPGVHPVIVYIHGGSWRSGSKSDYKRLGAELAGKGYAGFAIDYDLDAKAFPTSWNQARAAITFVRAHAVEYRIDPARILVAGDSAGGELAALIALAPEGPATARGPAIPVMGALIFNGIYDLHLSAGVIARYLGTDCGGGMPATVCDDASPVNQIHPGAPPFFVGHGTGDELVPYAQADYFAKQLRVDHDAVTLYRVEGAPHSYWDNRKYYAANVAAVEAFLATLPNATLPK